MNLTLTRSASTEQGTLGVLVAGSLMLRTIELPWRDNAADKSCVPAGEYEFVPYLSPKFGSTWRLHNPALNVYGTGLVPEGGRSAIEIHAANFARELEGCIAVGLSGYPMLDPITHGVVAAIQDSQRALEQLREALDLSDADATLTVSWRGSNAPAAR